MYSFCFFVFIIWMHLRGLIGNVSGNVLCEDLPEYELIDILGPAYNSRYMSIRKPIDRIEYLKNSKVRKRTTTNDFYVHENYSMVIAEKPAWNVNHFLIEEGRIERIDESDVHRYRRSFMDNSVQQWECEMKIVWKDLGLDYFPRYLRSVECTERERCWYGHFRCKPRSFTVKILKRRRDKCIEAAPNTRIGTKGLHSDLKRLWVWEEHAVNFCCDCSL
ncbi:prothoracicotropic hormone isoform f [Holotrichia oblita]|uniref:Prothoracicotropic hormone isoform f n=1 Tax=Holotrichia oblita TaxID=644536 RepID=A0ACB9SWA7_HOLOL|nr:prothoracicotropic hormone isoform f [Holotrichia oblita]